MRNIQSNADDDKLFIHDRWLQILRQLSPDKVTSIEVLSHTLNVSVATIRRDLNNLNEIGELKRVRGGAVAVENVSYPKHRLVGQEKSIRSADRQASAKIQIGKYAATLLEENEAIIIDGGTTTEQFSQAIMTPNLTVLTTSLSILNALYSKEKIRVLITGGEVFPEQNVVLNPYGDNIIDKFVATKIFLGAQAISDKGLLQTDPLLVHYEQGLIDRASEIIVLADSSKFQSKGSLIVCDLDTIDHIITDDAIESITVKILEAQNIKVTIVPSN
jgi:DeoR family transcriptional regulator, ulaG and ulaABCDEF operon transcriptional repressor